MNGITPLLNRVLVKPEEIETTTEGGIIIAETIAEKHMNAQSIGILIDVGPDAFKEYTTIKERWIDGGWKPVERTVTGYSEPLVQPGDRVAFAKFGGQKVWGEDGVEYRLMNDLDITAKVGEKVDFTDIHSRKRMSENE